MTLSSRAAIVAAIAAILVATVVLIWRVKLLRALVLGLLVGTIAGVIR